MVLIFSRATGRTRSITVSGSLSGSAYRTAGGSAAAWRGSLALGGGVGTYDPILNAFTGGFSISAGANVYLKDLSDGANQEYNYAVWGEASAGAQVSGPGLIVTRSPLFGVNNTGADLPDLSGALSFSCQFPLAERESLYAQDDGAGRVILGADGPPQHFLHLVFYEVIPAGGVVSLSWTFAGGGSGTATGVASADVICDLSAMYRGSLQGLAYASAGFGGSNSNTFAASLSDSGLGLQGVVSGTLNAAIPPQMTGTSISVGGGSCSALVSVHPAGGGDPAITSGWADVAHEVLVPRNAELQGTVDNFGAIGSGPYDYYFDASFIELSTPIYTSADGAISHSLTNLFPHTASGARYGYYTTSARTVATQTFQNTSPTESGTTVYPKLVNLHANTGDYELLDRFLIHGPVWPALSISQKESILIDDATTLTPTTANAVKPGVWSAPTPADISVSGDGIQVDVNDADRPGWAQRTFPYDATDNPDGYLSLLGYRYLRLMVQATVRDAPIRVYFVYPQSFDPAVHTYWDVTVPGDPNTMQEVFVDLCSPTFFKAQQPGDPENSIYPIGTPFPDGYGAQFGAIAAPVITFANLRAGQTYTFGPISFMRRFWSKLSVARDSGGSAYLPFSGGVAPTIFDPGAGSRVLWGDTDGRLSLELFDDGRSISDLALTINNDPGRRDLWLFGYIRPENGWSAVDLAGSLDAYHNNNLTSSHLMGKGQLLTGAAGLTRSIDMPLP